MLIHSSFIAQRADLLSSLWTGFEVYGKLGLFGRKMDLA